MEIYNYNMNKNHQYNFQELSKLSIELRKKKINQKLSESKVNNESNFSKQEEESENITKLCELSKTLLEQKKIDNIITSLDKIYFYLINIKIPIKPNYIKLSCIIPNLFQKIAFFEKEEKILKKIFDILEEIIKFLYYYDTDSKNSSVFNEQYFELIYRLIELYQNNEDMMKKILNFLSNLIEKSDYIKEYLMIKPGCYFIQAILSLDVLYPSYIIQLLCSFCNYENLDEDTMKDFEIMLIQECDKVITYFYKENANEPQIVINNSKLFQNLYSCLSFLSVSDLEEIKDIFLINNKINDVNLFDKIITFEKYDRENLSIKVLKIIVNLYCYSELKYIRILIENNSYQYVMDRLLDQFSNEDVIQEAAYALANFVNIEQWRKIFVEKNYLNNIITKITNNSSHKTTKALLIIISNLFFSINEIDILSFIDSDIFSCCKELLIKIKDPSILNSVLIIIEILLYKGDPNIYLKRYNKEDRIVNPFQYQFDNFGLYDILSNILLNCKNEQVCESIKRIFERYYNDNEINEE